MRMFNTTVGRLVLTACVAGLIAAAIGGVSLHVPAAPTTVARSA